MAFSPDGQTLTTASNGRLYFWALNASVGEEPLQRTITLNEGGGIIKDLRYSPDGRHLFTLNYNGTVYVLRLEGEVDTPDWVNELPEVNEQPRDPRPIPGSAGLDGVLEFDGKQTVGVAPDMRVDQHEQFTVEAWVLNWDRSVVHQGEGNQNWLWFGRTHSGDKDLRLWGGFHHSERVLSSFKVPVLEYDRDEWIHQAMTYDGKLIRVFVNGRLMDEVESAAPGPFEEDTKCKIGFDRAHPDGFASGQISELRISTTCRYTKNFNPQVTFEPDEHTMALYHFDETEGDIAHDVSGNERHMQLKSPKWVRVASE